MTGGRREGSRRLQSYHGPTSPSDIMVVYHRHALRRVGMPTRQGVLSDACPEFSPRLGHRQPKTKSL